MTNESSLNIENGNLQLQLTPEAETNLRSTAKWSFFLAIIGFLFMIFLILIGITMFGLSKVMSEYSDFKNLPFQVPYVLIGVFYIIIALIYFLPSYHLFKIGSKIQSGLKQRIQSDLDEGLKNLKRLFTFFGVMTIISISLSVIIFLLILSIKGLTMK